MAQSGSLAVVGGSEEQAESELRLDPRTISRALSTNGQRVTGRTTATPAGEQIAGLFAQYESLAYALPWEVLDYVELLATYNPDYSQAVDNIRTLANSGHDLFVDAGSKLKQRRIKAFLEEKARVVQEPHGGIDGLIDKLLDQAGTYGAMCGEWLVDEDLNGVVDFADVNPKSIRFFWELGHFAPYQLVNAKQAEEAKQRGQTVKNNCIKLNELTFHYYAFDAAPGSPYGTPPFLAALANIAIQRDMIENMAQIVKKIGLLGIIDISLKQMQKRPGETDEAFTTRAIQYLEAYAKVAQDMVKDGGIIHFDDMEATTFAISGNAAGATAIYKQNEEMIFSGMKSMPSVQGRSYSTTETYAGVAYDIIIRNTYKYQRAIKRMIERGYWLMTLLEGEDPKAISLTFHPNKSLHRMQDAQARRYEILNALMEWAAGFTDQSGAGQILGYSDVKTEYEEIPAHPIFGVRPAANTITSSSSGDGEEKPESDDEKEEEDGQEEQEES